MRERYPELGRLQLIGEFAGKPGLIADIVLAKAEDQIPAADRFRLDRGEQPGHETIRVLDGG